MLFIVSPLDCETEILPCILSKDFDIVVQPRIEVGFEQHDIQDSESERQRKNRENVESYFQSVEQPRTILSIAAGENPFPGSLSEDIEIQPNGEPALLAAVGEDISVYLPKGLRFAKVYIVNARNKKMSNTDYSWIVDVTHPVLESGGVMVIVFVDRNQRSYLWATTHESDIQKRGFTKVSPAAEGEAEPAGRKFTSLRGSVILRGRSVTFSMANAVQVVWKKN